MTISQKDSTHLYNCYKHKSNVCNLFALQTLSCTISRITLLASIIIHRTEIILNKICCKTKYSSYITKKYILTFVLGRKCNVEFKFSIRRVQSLLSWVSFFLQIRPRATEWMWDSKQKEGFLSSEYCLGDHPVSYVMGNAGCFPELKHTPTSS